MGVGKYCHLNAFSLRLITFHLHLQLCHIALPFQASKPSSLRAYGSQKPKALGLETVERMDSLAEWAVSVFN